MKHDALPRQITLPQPLRLPLAAVLIAGALATGSIVWRIDRAATTEALRLSRQSHHDLRAKQLMQQIASADTVSAGLAIYHRLHAAQQPSTAPYETAMGFPPGATIEIEQPQPTRSTTDLWREYTSRLQLTIPHEGHLLKLLADWRSQSDGLHQLRACRIERLADALQADCQLTRFELTTKRAP